MGLLAAHSPDPELRQLYGQLLDSEARHFGLYWLLCDQRYGRHATVARLQELAAVEVQALSGELTAIDNVRMHSVGVETRE
jgi:tRNA-(ms[2]io[6]A)-hydroxylase